MASKFELANRAHSYLRRLAKEYKVNGPERLASVLEGSKFLVNEETDFDNWNGGSYGHDVVLYVPDHLIGLVPLDQQSELQSKIREDLRTAAAGVENEYFHEIRFEYADDPRTVPLRAVPITGQPASDRTDEPSIWKAHTIRLFISHRDTHKRDAHALAKALEAYGVSSFVAHDTIEPDEDWQREIEIALRTMDAMLAFITDDFFVSPWTNQEIGFALARQLPVISLQVGSVDPVGFIRNRQAIKGSSSEASKNAASVFEVILKRLGTSRHLREAVIDRFAHSTSFFEAGDRFKFVARLEALAEEEISALVKAHNDNTQISHCFLLSRNDRFINFINERSKRQFVIRAGVIVEDDPV